MGVLERLRGQEKKSVTQLMAQGGFNLPAHISIEGNRFTLVDDLGNETPWQQFALDVVIVDMSEFTIRSFYGGRQYDPKSSSEERVPVCASSDGVTPDPNVQEPQSTHCRTCQWNKWNTDHQGRGGKGCTEWKRAAVMVVGGPQMAYLFKIGPGSQRAFRDYGAYLSTLPNQPEAYEIVTRVEFEPGSVGILKFTPVNWVKSVPQLQETLEHVAETGAFERVIAVPDQQPAGPALAAPQTASVSRATPMPPVQQGQLPAFGNSRAPVAPMGGPSGVGMSAQNIGQAPPTDPQMDEFLRWKAQQAAQVKPDLSAGQFTAPQAAPPKRTRRTKAEMEAAKAQEPGRTNPPPAPPQGFQPPAGFQPSPQNPFANGGNSVELQPPGMEGQGQPPGMEGQGQLFGMQTQPEGLTDGMKNALNNFLGGGQG